MKRLVALRRTSQAAFLSLFVYILWSTTYPLTGAFYPGAFFSLDPLLGIMTSVAERAVVPGLWYSLVMLALTAVFGRFFCGWICPIGAVIDIAGRTQRRHPVLSDAHNDLINKPKYYILLAILVIAIYGRQVAWALDPVALAGRFVSLNLIPAVTIAIRGTFELLIRNRVLGGAFLDLYHALKPTFLGVKAAYFSSSGAILVYFLVVITASLVFRRLWCRMICPLGALYALAARRSPFKRIVDRCMACDRCSNECRMGAIREDLSYERPECVLCMDCVYACPMHGVRFGFGQARAAEAPAGSGSPENQAGPGGRISRAQFLALAFSAAAILAPFSKSRAAAVDPETDDTERLGIIRPPAALEERDFKDRCVRCGNCMKVCVTNGLQPTMFETGYSGVWTPRLVPEIGYCEYKCTLCGRTCPTGAIPELSLEAKMKTRLGLAQLDRSICLPWADKKECIVCQEHCPVSEKAIVLDTDPASGVQRPRVVEERCVGCGICQNKCPVRPVRAITVSPAKSYRTRVSRGKRRR